MSDVLFSVLSALVSVPVGSYMFSLPYIEAVTRGTALWTRASSRWGVLRAPSRRVRSIAAREPADSLPNRETIVCEIWATFLKIFPNTLWFAFHISYTPAENSSNFLDFSSIYEDSVYKFPFVMIFCTQSAPVRKIWRVSLNLAEKTVICENFNNWNDLHCKIV